MAELYSVKAPGSKVRGYPYGMEQFLKECVNVYCEEAKTGQLKHVATPSLEESEGHPCWIDQEVGASRGWSVFEEQKLPAEVRMTEPSIGPAERSAAPVQDPSMHERLLPRPKGVHPGGPRKRPSEAPGKGSYRPLARRAPVGRQCAS